MEPLYTGAFYVQFQLVFGLNWSLIIFLRLCIINMLSEISLYYQRSRTPGARDPHVLCSFYVPLLFSIIEIVFFT